MAKKKPGVETISPAKFFAMNKSIAGFTNPSKSLFVSIRELVEDGLDAAEEAGNLPNIRIRLRKLSGDELDTIFGLSKGFRDRLSELKKTVNLEESGQESYEIFELIVEDNGVGMGWDEIPNLMGKVLTSKKYVLKQNRGRFGLGGKMVIIYSLQETNAPVEIWSTRSEDDYVSYYKLKIQLEKNEPILLDKKKIPKREFRDPWGKKMKSGTIIKVYLPGNWSGAKWYILEYLKQLSIITPYANIVFEDPTGKVHIYSRAVKKLPKPPEVVKYHPQGIDTQTLLELIEGTKAKTIKEFLTKELQRIGPRTAEEFLKVVGIDPNTPLSKIKRNDKIILRITEAAKRFKFMAPDASCLSPLGEELLEVGIKKIFKPEFVYVVQRKPISYGGHPMIIEVGLAYGGDISPGIHLYRFANRIPLLYKEKSDVAWKAIEEIDWSHYKIQKDSDPVAIFVSVVSTKIPFPETSKDYIDDIDILKREIKLALQEALRNLRIYLNKKRQMERAMKKKMTLYKYATNLVRSIASILKTDEKYKDSPYIMEDIIFSALSDVIDETLREKKETEIEEEIMSPIPIEAKKNKK